MIYKPFVRLIDELRYEFSVRFGDVIVAPGDAMVWGSPFSDFILAGSGQVHSGRGHDIVVLELGTTEAEIFGPGANTLVVPTQVAEAVTIDWVALTAGIVVLPDFGPGARAIDTGPGSVEIRDDAGHVVLLQATSPAGVPVPYPTIAQSIVIGPDQTPLVSGGRDRDPNLIFADGAETIGTSRSETILVEEISLDHDWILVDAGGGKDTILIDLRGKGDPDDPPFVVIDGGKGPDNFVMRSGPGLDDIEECLIYDFGGAGISSRPPRTDTAYFPDLSPNTVLTDLGGGEIRFFDSAKGAEPGSGADFTVHFHDSRGNPLALADIEDTFIFGELDLLT